MDCQICGGRRERTGDLIDISKLVGRKICKVSAYKCLDCGKKSIIDGTDVAHLAKG